MSINFPEWLFYGFGVLFAFAALRMLWRRGSLRALAWAIGWGSLAAAGILSLLAGADLGRYRSIVPDVVIATVTIAADRTTAGQAAARRAAAGQGADPYNDQHSADRFRVHIVARSGLAREVHLTGTHGILDMQTIHCRVPLCPVHLYRIRHFYAARAQSGDALPGYDTVAVGDSDSLLDVWYWLARVPRLRGLVRVTETATASLPVRDGARYEIRIDAEGRLRTTDIGY